MSMRDVRSTCQELRFVLRPAEIRRDGADNACTRPRPRSGLGTLAKQAGLRRFHTFGALSL